MNETNRTELRGRRALITGAGVRLGRAVAFDLGRQGCDIVIHYNRSSGAAEAVVAELTSLGVRATAVGADLSDEAAVLGMLDAAWDDGGPIDYLVNNASIFEDSRLPEIDFDDVIRNLRINAWAPFILTRRLAARLEDVDRQGAAVNLLDTRIVGGDAAHAAYHLSKRMLADLTRMCAVEFAPTLRVNGVAPGAVLPPPDRDEAYLAERGAASPMRVPGSAADITQAVRYLLTAPFVTGDVIFIDGGQHLRPEG